MMRRVFQALVRNWWAIYSALVIALLAVFGAFIALAPESPDDMSIHPYGLLAQLLIASIFLLPMLIIAAHILQYFHQRRLLYPILLLAITAVGYVVGLALIGPSLESYLSFIEIAEAREGSHSYYLTRYSPHVPSEWSMGTLFVHECSWFGTDCSPIFRAELGDPTYFDSFDQADARLEIEGGTLLILVHGNARAQIQLDK